MLMCICKSPRSLSAPKILAELYKLFAGRSIPVADPFPEAESSEGYENARCRRRYRPWRRPAASPSSVRWYMGRPPPRGEVSRALEAIVRDRRH